MMKLLHTSDWHLGKRLDSFSRFDEQQAVMNEICEIAEREKVNAVIIAGDLFDTYNPPVEAVDLFYKTLKRLSDEGKRAVICIAGNHDSPERIEAPDPLARECGIIFAGLPETEVSPFELKKGMKVKKSDKGFLEVEVPGCSTLLRILLTPYANEQRLKKYLGNENPEEKLRIILKNYWQELAFKYCDNLGVNILLTHMFLVKEGGEIPEEPEEERPILHAGGAEAIFSSSIPESIQYAAIGHLHRYQTIDTIPCPVIYSGSPLAYSFSEANQDKFVLIIEVEPDSTAKCREVKLNSGKRLLRKRFELIDDAVQWLSVNQDSLVEITIVSNTFLSAVDRKRLLDAHNGIIIIPELRNSEQVSAKAGLQVDLSRGISELFIDFFKKEKGQDPGEDILKLFNELISREEQI